jgi:transposase
MANNLVSMQHIRLLLQYTLKGFPQRKIARELSLSRNTVKRYTNRLTASEYSLAELLQLDDAELSSITYGDSIRIKSDKRLEDFKSRIPEWVKDINETGVQKLLLWEEYKLSYQEGYEYSQFCELLSIHQKTTSATMHFVHQPGAEMMVDFAGRVLEYVDTSSGELIKCPVFVSVLPYSGLTFVMALSDMKQPNVIRALNAALNYFGGVPQSVKFDNMRQAVKKSCRYEPVFTDTIEQWALHNNIALLAARPGRPKDKPHVEAAVRITYQRVYAPLREQVFYSLDDLNKAIIEQLALHHKKNLQRRTYNRIDRFLSDEKPLLQALPATPYEIKHVAKVKVQRNYHIILGEDWHFYSVPSDYIGKQVTAIYDADTVEIYYDQNRIALHQRSYKRHGYSTTQAHMPESHQKYHEQRGWTAEYFLTQAEKIGTSTHEYIQKVLNRGHLIEQNYTICIGILRLKAAYGINRLEAACKRGLRGTVFNYNTIKNILKHNLDKVPINEPPLFFTMPEHDNLRGAASYQ